MRRNSEAVSNETDVRDVQREKHSEEKIDESEAEHEKQPDQRT
jgi:hypothetical protein